MSEFDVGLMRKVYYRLIRRFPRRCYTISIRRYRDNTLLFECIALNLWANNSETCYFNKILLWSKTHDAKLISEEIKKGHWWGTNFRNGQCPKVISFLCNEPVAVLERTWTGSRTRLPDTRTKVRRIDRADPTFEKKIFSPISIKNRPLVTFQGNSRRIPVGIKFPIWKISRRNAGGVEIASYLR